MTSMSERYISATGARSLRLRETTSDVDVLIAAGWAQSGDPERSLALAAWRMKQTGDHKGFNAVLESCEQVLRDGEKRGIRVGPKWRSSLARGALFWWLNPKCMLCDGLGHPIQEGTPHLNWNVDCPHCYGSGTTPIASIVGHKYVDAAKLVTDHLDNMSQTVFRAMAYRLRNEMDEAIAS